MHTRGMDTSAILILVLGLALGVALGLLANRSRQSSAEGTRAGLTAERDAARTELDRLRGEHQLLGVRAGMVESQLAASQALLQSERRSAGERVELLRTEQERLVEQFRALSADALRHNNEAFLTLADERLKTAQQAHAGELEQRRQAVENLVAPLKDTLGKVEVQLRELESARLIAYTSLTEQVGMVRTTSEHLRKETSSLVNALRAPQTRGRWGEMQLRRVVEMAGMVEHVDFDEQASVSTADGTLRPDMVVRMAGGKNVVVDSKVTLAAYLEAADATDDVFRAERLAAHARHLRKHVEDLSAKAYWAQFSPAPEFVVLFVPGEAFLAPALEQEPTLLEVAMAKRVIIATPTTLMTLLRTVSYAWQQAALTDNARAVFDLGRELYDRLGRLGDHVDKLGRSISRVVGDYNAAVGSLETRVLVTARKMAELKVVEGELASPRPVEEDARALSSAPLLAAAAESRPVRSLPISAAVPGLAGPVDPGADEVETDPRYGVALAPATPAEGGPARVRLAGDGA
jgi:DNA recombination protein RmuC